MTPSDTPVMEDLMLSLLRAGLWDVPLPLEGQAWGHERYASVMQAAKEQAVAGLVAQALMASGVRLERADALEVFGLVQTIGTRNAEMDAAVAGLCRRMKEAGVRILVIKGQTLAALYPHARLRQSGDIDFLCHPDDWQRAMAFLREGLGITVDDTHSEKHVEFQRGGIQYEMHRMLTAFAYPGHQRYWDEVVMPAVWDGEHTVAVAGAGIPILPPALNILYTFVHIFYHLILEGVGLRQFCDWAMLLHRWRPAEADILRRHLEGVGLLDAFTGLGAILTDALGLAPEEFPFGIREDEHRQAPRLLANIMEMGNFGQNVRYRSQAGWRHGMEHLARIGRQAWRFHRYAPKETWWRIPYMFRWWGIKLGRMLRLGAVLPALLAWLSLLSSAALSAQEYNGTTGLLHVPSAETDSAGTFRGGGAFLSKRFMPEQPTSEGEKYNTFNYSIGLTAFPWLELSYNSILLKMHKNADPQEKVGYYNEDRRVNVKVLPLKEGRWWPAVAVGIDDIGRFHRIKGTANQNSYFLCYYGAASKHVDLRGTELGVHLAYRYYAYESNADRGGVVGGVTVRPRFFRPLRFVAEWDGKCMNVGADCLLWRHLFVQACLIDGRAFTGGIAYHFRIPY